MNSIFSPVSLSVAILTFKAVPTPKTPSHMSKMDASVTPKSVKNSTSKISSCTRTSMVVSYFHYKV